MGRLCDARKEERLGGGERGQMREKEREKKRRKKNKRKYILYADFIDGITEVK